MHDARELKAPHAHRPRDAAAQPPRSTTRRARALFHARESSPRCPRRRTQGDKRPSVAPTSRSVARMQHISVAFRRGKHRRLALYRRGFMCSGAVCVFVGAGGYSIIFGIRACMSVSS